LFIGLIDDLSCRASFARPCLKIKIVICICAIWSTVFLRIVHNHSGRFAWLTLYLVGDDFTGRTICWACYAPLRCEVFVLIWGTVNTIENCVVKYCLSAADRTAYSILYIIVSCVQTSWTDFKATSRNICVYAKSTIQTILSARLAFLQSLIWISSIWARNTRAICGAEKFSESITFVDTSARLIVELHIRCARLANARSIFGTLFASKAVARTRLAF